MMAEQPLPSLPRRLRAHAAEILALPRRVLRAPLYFATSDDYHEVRIYLYPRGAAEVPGLPRSGKWFSDLEQRIWDALAAGPLRGPQLAKAVGEEYGGRLRMLLSNLVDREVLVPGPRGYARAPSPPPISPKSQHPGA